MQSRSESGTPVCWSTSFATTNPACRPTLSAERTSSSSKINWCRHHLRWQIHKSHSVLLTNKDRSVVIWAEVSTCVWDKMSRLCHLPQQLINLQQFGRYFIQVWDDLSQNYHSHITGFIIRKCTAMINAQRVYTQHWLCDFDIGKSVSATSENMKINFCKFQAEILNFQPKWCLLPPNIIMVQIHKPCQT